MKIYYEKTLIGYRPDLVEDILNKEVVSGDELRKINRYYYHPQGLRRCSSCSNVLLANSDNFYIKRYFRNEQGEIVHTNLSGNCKTCDKERQALDKARQRDDPELYCRRIIPSLKSRAKEQSVPFNLTGEQLYLILQDQGFKCYYTGEPLDFSVVSENTNYPHRDMPSVDKMEPTLGYVVENTVWTLYYVNRAKNDLNHEEFLKLCQKVIQNIGQG